MTDSKPTIVVVGAGVIGLTIALKLQSSHHHHQVLLVSHEWPTSIPGAPTRHSADYASMWAGAHVRPIPATTPQLQREAAWLRTTVAEFERQAREAPWMGVAKCPGVEYLEAPGPDYTRQTAESFARETGLSGYRLHGKHELPQGVQLGFEYDTFCVNSPVYCASLLRLFVAGGGKTLQRHLKSEWEGHCLASDVHLVINASGTGFGDIKTFPTRGQTCLTNLTSATKTVTRQKKDGSWSFIIPRFFGGGTVVGGTKQPGDWSTEPNPATRRWLLSEGAKITGYATGGEQVAAETISVIADVVGRRPTREGGMRIEAERRDVVGLDGKKRTDSVLHAYGAGGRGYEISWGVAAEVVHLVEGLVSQETTGPVSKL